MAFYLDNGAARRRPRIEAGGGARKRPAAGVHGHRGGLLVVEKASGELQKNLRLRVATHGAEHCRQLAVASGERGGERVRWASARGQLGRVARFEVEAETTVVQVDLRVRLDQP